MEENNNPNRQSGGGDKNKPPKNRQSIMVFLVVAMVTMLAWNYISSLGAGNNTITYNEFMEMLDKGEVESVELASNQIKIVAKEKNARGGDVVYATGIMPDYQLEQKLSDAGVSYEAEMEDMRALILSVFINVVLPVLLLWTVFGLIMRKMGGGGMMGMGVGKSKAKVYIEKETGVTFKDVAGLQEEKEDLREIVDFLKMPQKYQNGL